jgi:hypothetical protein
MAPDHGEANLDLLYGPPWIWAAAIVIVIAVHCIVDRNARESPNFLLGATRITVAVVAVAPLVCIIISLTWFTLTNRMGNSILQTFAALIPTLLIFAPQNFLTVPMYVASRSANLPHLILLLVLALGFQLGGIWWASQVDF